MKVRERIEVTCVEEGACSVSPDFRAGLPGDAAAGRDSLLLPGCVDTASVPQWNLRRSGGTPRQFPPPLLESGDRQSPGAS